MKNKNGRKLRFRPFENSTGFFGFRLPCRLKSDERPVKIGKLGNACVARIARSAGIVIRRLRKEIYILGINYFLEVGRDTYILRQLSYGIDGSLAVLLGAHFFGSLNAHGFGYIAVFLTGRRCVVFHYGGKDYRVGNSVRRIVKRTERMSH